LRTSVPAANRLGPGTPTFRANLFVPEGQRSSTAVINLQDGVVMQDLPFDVELKKFIVDYYDTGMPKLFASEIVIHDHDSGASIPALVKVNEPAFHRGVAIYQSSFDDGGSALKLRGLPMSAGGKTFDIDGVVGGKTQISNGAAQMTLEFTGLLVINVENLGGNPAGGGATDVRKVDLVSSLQEHLGSGAKGNGKKELRNVGPSVSYKLRDAAGQAREFNNYMLPVELDGSRVFLVGARDKPDQEMRYLRIPADDKDSVDGWARLRAGLLDPGLRTRAAARYVALASPPDKPEMAAQLTTTAERALALFAGAESAQPKGAAGPAEPRGGLQAISDFIEGSVPEADRMRISQVLLRILNGSLFELLNLTRANTGLPALPADDKTQAFMTQSVLSLSDSFFYPAPVLFQLTDFTQVQASVFQVARAPGKKLVYLGAILLIVGVFAMLYIRERRLWVWLTPAGSGTKITTAMSTTRRTLDADAEFEQLKRQLLKEAR
jgi:cytochrome c biogenesis protein